MRLQPGDPMPNAKLFALVEPQLQQCLNKLHKATNGGLCVLQP
jgi:hypothetical protein